ncbi:MAG: ornithine carbamoyltransferase [Candidatus Aenigmarchaeota archaeon]|nr:ornithine carbamoyltransferase [Candidatus Aenigmarchaeota archaeon]
MLAGKDLLSVQDLSAQEIKAVFDRTRAFKRRPFGTQLKNKTLVMLFAKPSTRTRVSFEVGINQLGGDDIYLEFHDAQVSRGETIADTARVLSRYCDGIVARLFAHADLVEMAATADVPVINGLTDLFHPCQALTDLFTIEEKLGRLRGLKLAFVGDGNNNITHSLMHACSKLGVHLAVASPKGYGPRPEVVADFRKNAATTGAQLWLVTDPVQAATGADVVYTDTWVSMGEEAQAAARERALRPYQVNRQLLAHAPRALVMHDLPAHRGQEIASEVMDGPRSIIFDQAENRLHVEKALLALIFGKG